MACNPSLIADKSADKSWQPDGIYRDVLEVFDSGATCIIHVRHISPVKILKLQANSKAFPQLPTPRTAMALCVAPGMVVSSSAHHKVGIIQHHGTMGMGIHGAIHAATACFCQGWPCPVAPPHLVNLVALFGWSGLDTKT